jgi:hypothetical protein
MITENPFAVQTPETLSPLEVAQLFEYVFTDVSSLLQPGHMFIHGPRGSGKSMMFRYMLPEVQREVKQIDGQPFILADLDFYAIHFTIRHLDIVGQQKKKLLSDVRLALVEHYLVMKVTQLLLESLKLNIDLYKPSDSGVTAALETFFEEFRELSADFKISVPIKPNKSLIDSMLAACAKEFRGIQQHLKLDSADAEPYKGGVTNFLDYFISVAGLARDMGFMPRAPFFLLIDDADNLTPPMQRIINTWVSYRTTNVVSIKISTQMRYATYRTISDFLIETPHDFNEVDLTQIYTSKRDSYFDRLQKIIEKRLRLAGIDTTPEDYFPTNLKQVEEIEVEKRLILERHPEHGVSSRPNDDVYRYAIPNYMVGLTKSKKSNIYSYSGFKTLVDLSSGIIRFFLELASRMVEETYKTQGLSTYDDIKFIPHSTQNTIARKWSNDFIEDHFLGKSEDEVNLDGAEGVDVANLKNLVMSLGKLFANKLLDEEASERRVFSIMTEETLPANLERVVQLGVSFGYLHRSSIRAKESVGRKQEIILSRRLAPYFYLDVSGYSGRLSVTVDDLKLACKTPNQFVSRRLKLEKIDPKVSDNGMESLFSVSERSSS